MSFFGKNLSYLFWGTIWSERAHPSPGPEVPMGYTQRLGPISDPPKESLWAYIMGACDIVPSLLGSGTNVLHHSGAQAHFPDWVVTGPPWGTSPGLSRDLGVLDVWPWEEAHFILCKIGQLSPLHRAVCGSGGSCV